MTAVPGGAGRPAAGVLALLLALGAGGVAPAQDRREAEKKLADVKRELDAVASERRRLEGQRGDAARQLRQADEQVGQTSRRLRELEQQLAQDEAKLAQLQQRRASLQQALGTRRTQLQHLVRAAYMQPDAAPLKTLLSQDRVADGQRLLTYQRYLQRERAQRITALSGELQELGRIEDDIARQRVELAALRAQQRDQLSQLERDRQARAAVLAKLDERYQDRRAREQALGRDAQALEQLLRQLRAAAARAQAERAKAEREAAARAARKPGAGTAPTRRAAPAVAKTPAPQVGGLGWPVSGALLSGFGAAMPDGRRSDGLLIGASAGAPVKAVAEGTVVYAEWMTGYGLLLIIDHGNGYMSLYAHNDALLKRPGDRVRQGDAVGTVGASGGHGRPALYFELRRNGAPVNPGTWLRR